MADAVTWSSGSTLTLSAYRNIAVNANLAGGTGSKIVLRADSGATGNGTVSFGSGIKATASGGVSLYYNPGSYAAPIGYSANAGVSTTLTAYMLVNTLDNLQAINTNLSGTYALGTDIDASATAGWNSGAGFEPIGNDISKFTGTFDGDGHVITGLTINRSGSSYVGLFGYANTGSILRDVGLVGGSVSGNEAVGGLVGYNLSSEISNAYATGGVSGSGSVGGLVGLNLSGTITNAYSTGSVTSSGDYVGGLVGFNVSSEISNAYASGSVTGGGSYVGGLVGYNAASTLSNAYATGIVSGDTAVGGLVGHNFYSTIKNTYASGSVEGSTDVGGLLGYSEGGTNENSYFDRKTTGQSNGVGSGDASGVTGLTTAEARSASSFRGFDFTNTWYQAGDMRPILRSEAAAPVDGVITVSNLHQLQLIGANLSASYRLTGDIDASVTDAAAEDYDASGIWGTGGFVPIGNNNTSFTGTFDGDGHVITGLTIYRPNTNSVGLFGYAGSASILRNVGLEGGSITGSGYVGGLVGTNTSGAISNAYASGSVTGGYEVGGLAGYSSGTISNAYATGSVVGDGSYVGGLVGYNSGTISNAYATGSVTGSVTGSDNVGGLVGRNASGTISNAYATGGVTGRYEVGGLVGWSSSGTISNAYATGIVTGREDVGGLVGGSSSLAISNAYASGSVTGSRHVGGLVGYNNSGTITASYFDTDKTNQSNGVGTGDGEVTGLTTEQFQDTAGFYALASAAGWDFETVWAPPSQDFYPELYALSDVVFVKTDGQTITYGDAPGPLTYSDVYGGHSGAGVFAPTLTTEANATSNVGSYAISGEPKFVGDDGITYRTVYGPGVVTINKAKLTVTADNGSMIYGDAVPTIGYTVTGWKNDQTGALLTGVNVTTDADKASDAGTGYITTAAGGTLSGDATGNYTLSYEKGAFEVKKATLTVTADNGSMIYGDAVPTIGYTVTGWKNDQTGALLTGVNVTTDADKASNAGTGYITTAAGGTLSGDAMGNYTLSYEKGAFEVKKAALTVTANSGSMIYGDAVPTIGYTVTGWKNDQTGALLTGVNVTTDADKASNAGTGYITTAAGGTLSGDAMGNYTLSYEKGAFEVKKAALTVTANSGSMIYGDAVPTIGYTVTGWKNGQSDALLTDIGVTADAFSTSDVGTGYKTTASGGTLSGNASGNYTLDYVDGSFSVTPRALKITAKDASKTYGDVASLTGYSVNGLVNGDEVNAVDLTSVGRAATANAASYDIVASDATGSGLLNYKINYVDGTLTVNKATLTVTADNGSMIYGDAVPTIGYSVSGWRNGQDDALLTGVNVATNASSISNVGSTYSTFAAGGELSGAAFGNYTLDYVDGSFAVTPRALTVTASDVVKTYGDTASLTGFTTTGLVNGDSVSAVSEKSLGADAEADVGSYDIIAGGATGKGLSNYVISYDKGTLTVNKALLTVTANNGSMIYGDALPTIGYAVSGWKNGQNGSLLSGVVVATDATSSSDVGAGYSTAASGGALSGAAAGNYDISYVAGSMTVQRRAITVAANAAAKTYGDLGLLSYTVGGMGLANGDSLSGELESAGVSGLADVGSYAISQGSVTDAANGNYAISYEGNTLAVTPRAVTVTANDADKEVGFPAGAFTWFVSAGNLVNGDALSGTLESAGAPADAPVGVYAITAGSLTDAQNPNYAITFVPGELEVLSIPAPAVAGSLPLPEAQFGPGGFAGPATQMAFGGSQNQSNPLILTDPSVVSVALCGMGAQTLIVCQ